MIPVIRPEIINILGGTAKANSTGIHVNESRPEQSRWKKFTSWLSETCEIFKPLVDMFVAVVSAATMLIKVCGKYQQCRRKEIACA